MSALDVSVQAQVLNLLEAAAADFELTYLFIAHDLALVRHISDRVAVMYLGKIVELAREAIYERPSHPYTGALLSAVPVEEPSRGAGTGRRARRRRAQPSILHPACRFHPRCPRFQQGTCDVNEPQLEPKDGDQHHLAACHYPLEGWPLPDLRLPSTAASA